MITDYLPLQFLQTKRKEVFVDVILYIIGGLVLLSIISWLRSKPSSRLSAHNEFKDDPDATYALNKLAELDWGESAVGNKTKLTCKITDCDKPIYLQHFDASILVELLRERGNHKMDTFCASHAREKIEALKASYTDSEYTHLLNKAQKVHATYFKRK